MDIKTTLLNSLRKLAQQHTEENLGNRKDYIGASDIGYCPRKVVLEKIEPGEHDLATLLRFQRGHMAEDIIAMAFNAAGYSNFERQVEIVVECDAPLKVHIDFVFTSRIHKIKSILEVKSVSVIPDGPYSSWETQLYVQMGALARKYPEHEIRGSVLALDLAGGDVGFFNGYVPQNNLFDGLVRRAETIWSDYQGCLKGTKKDLPTEVSPLCGFCDHLLSCPKFTAEAVPQLDDSVTSLLGMQREERHLQEKIAQVKKQLLGVVGRKGPILSGGCFLQKATRSRKYLDTEKLSAFLAENGCVLADYQEDRPFSFLEVRKNKKAKEE